MLDSTYQRRAHAPYEPHRSRIIQALQDHAGPTLDADLDQTDRSHKMAAKLSCCCQHAAIHETEDGGIVVTEARCRSRLCPRCARIRAWELQARLTRAIREANSPRMLTVTLRANDAPLREQIDRLTHCFKRLRGSKAWTQHIQGGAYVIEVTYNHASHQWHPHIHALVDGRYWPQSAIADHWQRITGDSRIVDIRMIYDASHGARYIAGYAAKSSNTTNIPDDLIPEWAHQVHGLRMIQTFGSLHGVRLHPDDEAELPSRSQVAWADDLVDDADHGDPDASLVVVRLLNASTGIPRRLSPGTSPEHEAWLSETLECLRTWAARHRQETHRDRTVNRHPPPSDDRAGDRSLWHREVVLNP